MIVTNTLAYYTREKETIIILFPNYNSILWKNGFCYNDVEVKNLLEVLYFIYRNIC
jgi:hypothetical protein